MTNPPPEREHIERPMLDTENYFGKEHPNEPFLDYETLSDADSKALVKSLFQRLEEFTGSHFDWKQMERLVYSRGVHECEKTLCDESFSLFTALKPVGVKPNQDILLTYISSSSEEVFKARLADWDAFWEHIWFPIDDLLLFDEGLDWFAVCEHHDSRFVYLTI